jgi:peptidoglycan LD-endopeptidase LytH
MWRLLWIACLIWTGLPPTIAPSQSAGNAAYRFPVEPVAEASFAKGGHAYPAIDIFAPEGCAFVAPISGVIEDVQRDDRWSPKPDDPALRGGRWVSLTGDDGFRYYGSHLLRVEPGLAAGQRIAAGAKLGDVGRSGNARKTPPHLHFGISSSRHPYSWRVRRGEIDPYPVLRCMLRKDCNPRLLHGGQVVCLRFLQPALHYRSAIGAAPALPALLVARRVAAP